MRIGKICTYFNTLRDQVTDAESLLVALARVAEFLAGGQNELFGGIEPEVASLFHGMSALNRAKVMKYIILNRMVEPLLRSVVGLRFNRYRMESELPTKAVKFLREVWLITAEITIKFEYLVAQIDLTQIDLTPLERLESLGPLMEFLNIDLFGQRRIFRMYRPLELPPEFAIREMVELVTKLTPLFGVCRVQIQVNDELVVIPGCDVPLILRPLDGDGVYRLVGAAYVDGIMEGEAVGKLPETEIRIR